ncbi:MAG: hypothetical protein NVSMB14_16890 [Isosphaeraceae bacterium]
MELTFECPSCVAKGAVAHVESATSATCSACGLVRELRSEGIESGNLVACPWCTTKDMYIQKDFPHGMGLAIVIGGFALSTIFWYFYMPILTIGILLGTAALDLLLFYLVGDVTICYRCLCQYRGAGANPNGLHSAFDLAIGERYRQERLRIEELRSQGG